MARILVIEDDAELVQVLSLGLFKGGYEVHYAFNGREGFEKTLSLRPDLILLDLMMPVMPGTEVLKKLSEDSALKDIPVIVMTAYGAGDQARLLESSVRAQGAREYILKPFTPREMLRLIARVLANSGAAKRPERREIVKGAARLDPVFRTLWVSDRRIATLAPKRAKLLQLLLQAKGPVRREKLISSVWGDEAAGNLLEKTIQRLREDLGSEQHRLQTRPDAYEFIS